MYLQCAVGTTSSRRRRPLESRLTRSTLGNSVPRLCEWSKNHERQPHRFRPIGGALALGLSAATALAQPGNFGAPQQHFPLAESSPLILVRGSGHGHGFGGVGHSFGHGHAFHSGSLRGGFDTFAERERTRHRSVLGIPRLCSTVRKPRDPRAAVRQADKAPDAMATQKTV
jgi:hypothetical protein